MKTHNKGEEDNKSEVSTDHEPQRTCFVIMPISDHIDYAPGHFKRVYNYIIEPACRAAGFEAKRADDVKSANVIMLDVLESILHSDMAICDLSARNPNVMYELGIRQSFGMPVALIKDYASKEMFDIQGLRYEEYDSQLRIDLVREAVERIAEAIKHTYEKRDSDVSSLVQLLGRSKAVIQTSDLSTDTRVILDAIDQLFGQIRPVEPPVVSPTSPITPDYVDLMGLVLRRGDRVRSGIHGIGAVTGLLFNNHKGGYGVTVQFADQSIYFNSIATGNLTKLKEGEI